MLLQRDVSRALGVVADAGAVATAEAFPAAVLPPLRALIGADVASFSGGSGDPAPSRFDPGDALVPVGRGELESRADEHPVVAYMVRTGDRSAARISDRTSQRAFERLPLYQERFRPIGARHQLLAGIGQRGPVPTGIGFARERRDFGERELTLLELLRPHLETTYRRLRLRNELDEARLRALGLTAREGEILALVARGRRNAEIARTLVVSVRTVEKHLEQLYRKLGVSSRVEAVAVARGDT